MKKLTYLILFLFKMAIEVNAAGHYYVSNQGSDYGDGSENDPWQTIYRVNQKSDSGYFHSGDIISFRCGDTFSGFTLKPKQSGLTFNSYGTGNKPTIDATGADTIFVWNGERTDKYLCCIYYDWSNNNRDSCNFVNLRFVNGIENIELPFTNYFVFDNCIIDSNTGNPSINSSVNMGVWGGSHLTVKNCHFPYTQSVYSGNEGHGECIYLAGCDT
jgi:hypothetical protein